MPLEDVRDPSMSPTERDRALSLSRELEISAFQSEGRVRTRPAPDDGALDAGRGQRERVSRILDLDGRPRRRGVPGQAADGRQPPRRSAVLRRLYRDFI